MHPEALPPHTFAPESVVILRSLIVGADLLTLVLALLCLPSWRKQSDLAQGIGLVCIGYTITTAWANAEQIAMHTPTGTRVFAALILAVSTMMFFLKTYIEQVELRAVLIAIRREANAQRRELTMTQPLIENNEGAEVPVEPIEVPAITTEPTQVKNKGQAIKRTTIQNVVGNIVGFVLILPIVLSLAQEHLSTVLPEKALGYLAGAFAVSAAISGLVTAFMANPAVNQWLTKIGLGARTKDAQAQVEQASTEG